MCNVIHKSAPVKKVQRNIIEHENIYNKYSNSFQSASHYRIIIPDEEGIFIYNADISTSPHSVQTNSWTVSLEGCDKCVTDCIFVILCPLITLLSYDSKSEVNKNKNK
jgi:uncharacterized protein (UPF0210 family)